MVKGCFGGRCGHSFNRCGVLDADPHAGASCRGYRLVELGRLNSCAEDGA